MTDKDNQNSFKDWNSFSDWVEGLSARKDARFTAVMDKIEKLRPKICNDEYIGNSNLIYDLLVECWQAKNWNKSGVEVKDKSHQLRADYKSLQKEAASARKKIKQIEGVIKNKKLSFALGSAFFKLKKEGIKIKLDTDTDMDMNELWSTIITALYEVLDEPIYGVTKVPFLFENTYAGLFSDKPLWGKRLPRIESILLFKLVFLFRNATTDGTKYKISPLSIGAPMPKTGSPCYQLASDLVALTFDKEESMAPDEAKSRVRTLDNNSWRWGAWKYKGV